MKVCFIFFTQSPLWFCGEQVHPPLLMLKLYIHARDEGRCQACKFTRNSCKVVCILLPQTRRRARHAALQSVSPDAATKTTHMNTCTLSPTARHEKRGKMDYYKARTNDPYLLRRGFLPLDRIPREGSVCPVLLSNCLFVSLSLHLCLFTGLLNSLSARLD